MRRPSLIASEHNIGGWKTAQLFCTLALVLASAAIARADFEAGKRAYEQGDYATALKELTPLAEQGNAEAQVLLGLMHFEGQGVPRDPSQALKWYKAAAEQGNPEGQLQLGVMYLMGIGVARNTPQALKLLKLSADQGTRDAQVFLGLAYRNLQDAPRDFLQAYMWFHLAALQGDPLAPKQRDDLERLMTPDQVAKARGLAAAWKSVSSTKALLRRNKYFE